MDGHHETGVDWLHDPSVRVFVLVVYVVLCSKLMVGKLILLVRF